MKKTLIIAGVAAVLLLVLVKQAKAKSNPYDQANWDYVDGYRPQSGVIL